MLDYKANSNGCVKTSDFRLHDARQLPTGPYELAFHNSFEIALSRRLGGRINLAIVEYEPDWSFSQRGAEMRIADLTQRVLDFRKHIEEAAVEVHCC